MRDLTVDTWLVSDLTVDTWLVSDLVVGTWLGSGACGRAAGTYELPHEVTPFLGVVHGTHCSLQARCQEAVGLQC